MGSVYGNESVRNTQRDLMVLASQHSHDQQIAETLVDLGLSEANTLFYLQNEQAALGPEHPLNDDGYFAQRAAAAESGNPIEFALLVSQIMNNAVELGD